MTHWITYSEPSANRLTALLQQLGQSAICESVTRIEPLSPEDPFPEKKPDLIIPSQHAVAVYLDHYFKPSHEGLVLLQSARPQLPSSSNMVHWRCSPRVANSEGLLAMPQVQALRPRNGSGC